MAKIIFLGTSSSVPTKKRDNTSFLFLDKKQAFLVDCPGAIVQKLLKAGRDFRKLQNVIITHEHPDHLCGIASLVHTQAHLNEKLNIFSNPPTIKIIKRLLKLFDLDRKPYPKIDYLNVCENHFFYAQGNLRLAAVKNKHSKGSFGVKFIFQDKSLLYTSDTSFHPPMLKRLSRLNYLIHDCTASSSFFNKHPLLKKMHTNAKELAGYLRRKGKVKLIPVHFLLLRKDEEKRIKKELKGLGRRVIFVRDFQTLTL